MELGQKLSMSLGKRLGSRLMRDASLIAILELFLGEVHWNVVRISGMLDVGYDIAKTNTQPKFKRNSNRQQFQDKGKIKPIVWDGAADYQEPPVMATAAPARGPKFQHQHQKNYNNHHNHHPHNRFSNNSIGNSNSGNHRHHYPPLLAGPGGSSNILQRLGGNAAEGNRFNRQHQSHINNNGNRYNNGNFRKQNHDRLPSDNGDIPDDEVSLSVTIFNRDAPKQPASEPDLSSLLKSRQTQRHAPYSIPTDRKSAGRNNGVTITPNLRGPGGRQKTVAREGSTFTISLNSDEDLDMDHGRDDMEDPDSADAMDADLDEEEVEETLTITINNNKFGAAPPPSEKPATKASQSSQVQSQRKPTPNNSKASQPVTTAETQPRPSLPSPSNPAEQPQKRPLKQSQPDPPKKKFVPVPIVPPSPPNPSPPVKTKPFKTPPKPSAPIAAESGLFAHTTLQPALGSQAAIGLLPTATQTLPLDPTVAALQQQLAQQALQQQQQLQQQLHQQQLQFQQQLQQQIEQQKLQMRQLQQQHELQRQRVALPAILPVSLPAALPAALSASSLPAAIQTGIVPVSKRQASPATGVFGSLLQQQTNPAPTSTQKAPLMMFVKQDPAGKVAERVASPMLAEWHRGDGAVRKIYLPPPSQNGSAPGMASNVPSFGGSKWNMPSADDATRLSISDRFGSASQHRPFVEYYQMRHFDEIEENTEEMPEGLADGDYVFGGFGSFKPENIHAMGDMAIDYDDIDAEDALGYRRR
ncbi:hypothetical protein HDU97_005303 [Phlyctochytrium planicorne]|nr:hypothetical protein HDU97_005303 [Phlyctochytrium planicorne]